MSFPTRPLPQAPPLQHAGRSQSVEVHRSFGLSGRPTLSFQSSSFDSASSPLARARPDEERSPGNVYQDPTALQLAFGPMRDIGRWYSARVYCQIDPQDDTLVNGDDNSWQYKPDHNLTQRLRSRTFSCDSAFQSVPDVDDNLTDLHASGSGRALASAPGQPLATSLTIGLRDLATYGWYWGPVARLEAEQLLDGRPDGTFLMRDSSDDRYLLSLTFRSQGKTLHTRVEHFHGYFSFYQNPSPAGRAPTIAALIEKSMQQSKDGAFCYSRTVSGASNAIPVRLVCPFSRFSCLRSLQQHCRFVIRQNIRYDLIKELPIPKSMKEFVRQSPFT